MTNVPLLTVDATVTLAARIAAALADADGGRRVLTSITLSEIASLAVLVAQFGEIVGAAAVLSADVHEAEHWLRHTEAHERLRGVLERAGYLLPTQSPEETSLGEG